MVAGDTITILATAIDESDIAGYELRMGSSWKGGLFIGFNETPNFRFVGVRPGTHTFWLAAQGNNGYYSANPVSATCTVFYPPSYVDIPLVGTWSWDFDGIGTFVNTELTTHSAQDALMCSQEGALVGTWLSPEYDLKSIMTVRVWGDFLYDFVQNASIWDSIFPSGATWSNRITSTTTWDQLIAAGDHGKIEATLYWGDTTGNLTNSASGIELLAAEFSARYLRLLVTITDPNYESNIYLYTLNMTAAYWS